MKRETEERNNRMKNLLAKREEDRIKEEKENEIRAEKEKKKLVRQRQNENLIKLQAVQSMLFLRRKRRERMR